MLTFANATTLSLSRMGPRTCFTTVVPSTSAQLSTASPSFATHISHSLANFTCDALFSPSKILDLASHEGSLLASVYALVTLLQQRDCGGEALNTFVPRLPPACCKVTTHRSCGVSYFALHMAHDMSAHLSDDLLRSPWLPTTNHATSSLDI